MGSADADLDDASTPRDVENTQNESQYWSEPKRHFGLKTDKNTHFDHVPTASSGE